MSMIATTGKRHLVGDVWHDDRGEIPGYPDQWDPPMTAAEKHEAALSDPDNPPQTPERLARMRRISPARFIRRKLAMSVARFAAACAIPEATLRAWERHEAEPTATEMAYLHAIERLPDALEVPAREPADA